MVLKTDLITRTEAPRSLIEHQGGAQIDMSESAARHLLHRQYVPDYGIEPPPSKPSRFAGFVTRLVWLALGMAVTLTIILAAMRP